MSESNETKLNAGTSTLVSIFDRASARTGPTAEATARYVYEHTMVRAVNSLGRVVSQTSARKNSVLDRNVADLMSRLYFDAKCGRAAAEYNLEKAGMIEMIFGHVAGQMGDGDNFWDDIRWTLTERGRCTSMAKLQRIILRDPPLEIALWDVKDEADDVAGDCGGWEPGGPFPATNYRILAHLSTRTERILAAERRRRRRWAFCARSSSSVPVASTLPSPRTKGSGVGGRLTGEWSENTKHRFHSFHAESGEVLNWWPDTGTVQVLG